jgi:hypothetical protein
MIKSAVQILRRLGIWSNNRLLANDQPGIFFSERPGKLDVVPLGALDRVGLAVKNGEANAMRGQSGGQHREKSRPVLFHVRNDRYHAQSCPPLPHAALIDTDRR